MLDKEKYPELYNLVERSIRARMDWLEEAINAKFMIDKLPEEIKAMDIYEADADGDGSLSISIHGDAETVKKLKMLGIQGLKIQVSSYSKSNFYAHGQGELNGTCLRVFVGNLDKPENCHIEEQTRTVTDNVLICDLTGEKI